MSMAARSMEAAISWSALNTSRRLLESRISEGTSILKTTAWSKVSSSFRKPEGPAT
jgi:hypothetical protein